MQKMGRNLHFFVEFAKCDGITVRCGFIGFCCLWMCEVVVEKATQK